MDEAKDGGVDWRKLITPKLWKMGIGVIDPCDKPNIGYEEGPDFREKLHAARDSENYDEISSLCKPIVGNDLRSQHVSHFIIMYVDKETFMFGTTVEFAWAIQQRKPVLIVCKQGKKNIPLFSFGMNPHKMMFNNFDELFCYLERVDNGQEEDLRRWYFFDMDKIFGRHKGYNLCHT